MKPKTAYVIGLGDGINVTPAKYLAAYRSAESSPNQQFKTSFRDPRGWHGRSYTGSQIVAQHWDMIYDRWAQQWQSVRNWGSGNRAAKRAISIKKKNQQCRWCGSLTGGNEFCNVSCRVSWSH